MYTAKINYDGDLLYDPSKGILLYNPVLVLEDNCAGSFEFDINPEHPLYNRIIRFYTEISVYRDGDEIWAGRVIEESTDFRGIKHAYCEGLLSALYDTIQPPAEYNGEGADVNSFLNSMLSIHNSQIGTRTYRWRPAFYAGIVGLSDNIYRYTNYETTLECIHDKLINRLGGHLVLRRRNTVSFFLDYRDTYVKTAEQVIRFGQNLLDYTKNYDASELATVIVPLGARLEGQSDIQALEKYLDVSSVNNGSIFVRNEALVSQYGACTKVVRWDDVTVPANLLSKAEKYLNEAQYDNMQLEIRAVDFNLADPNVPPIDLLDEIRVVSPPHGLDRYFPVTKMEIPLDSPENMILTLGTAVKTSLTKQSNDRSAIIKEFIDSYVPPSTVLKNAQEQASELIKSGTLGGHVVLLPNELYITDNEDITAAQKVWRWNINGLGYSSTGKDGTYGTAITMQGKINANYITVGTMKADRIRGGTLTLGGSNNKNGLFYLTDRKGNTMITLNNEGITLNETGVVKMVGYDTEGKEYSTSFTMGELSFKTAGVNVASVYTGYEVLENSRYAVENNYMSHGLEILLDEGGHHFQLRARKHDRNRGYINVSEPKMIYFQNIDESKSKFHDYDLPVYNDTFYFFDPVYLNNKLCIIDHGSVLSMPSGISIVRFSRDYDAEEQTGRRVYIKKEYEGKSAYITINGVLHRFMCGLYVGTETEF